MRPPPAQTLFDEATQLLEHGDAARAEIALRLALAQRPDFAEAHANLALLLERRGDAAAAERHYRRALELLPTHGGIWTNFGALLERLKRYAQAEQAQRRALAHDAQSAAAWTNLGVLLDTVRRDDEAERCHRTALELAPGWAHAEFNLAVLLLRRGRFDEGWRRLEARDWYRDLDARIGVPRWRGGSPRGLSILVGIDAGHGDMIQFCRYAAELKRRGAARVGVLCHPALKTLFERVDGIDHAIAAGVPAAALPDVAWDLWCPMLSLPHLCATTLSTIPAALPYIAADPARVARWARVVDDVSPAMRIGLVWRGNPRFANDAERSLPSLRTLAPLADVPGVRWYSLQHGAGEDDAAGAPFPLEPLGASIDDFDDTAAILAQLDLLISVDTAAAHLAGAMARPCWVLLPRHKTDWRWLDARDDSPWYPGVMRLFRQGPDAGWDDVVERLRGALLDAVRRRDAAT
jgi:Tfp pilus assembly protein PilF